MKKTWSLLLASTLAIGWIAQGEAVVVIIDAPGVVFQQRQPIQAIIVDSNGNTYQQTVYYDSVGGGVDLDTSWAGPNASVYFPDLGIGYVWYQGYWIDEKGYYWDGRRQVYIGNPHWQNHWTNYWRGHWNERYGRWHDNWGDRGHGGGWNREGWRGGERGDWHDREHGDWNREGWRNQERGEGRREGWNDRSQHGEWQREGRREGEFSGEHRNDNMNRNFDNKRSDAMRTDGAAGRVGGGKPSEHPAARGGEHAGGEHERR